MAWVAVALAALAVVVFSVPVLFGQLATLCRSSAEACFEQGRLTSGDLASLREAGLSLRSYAALDVGVDTFSRLAWFVVGAVIFLRRSGDPMALVVASFLVTFGTATFASDGVEALAAVHPVWWVTGRSVQVLGEVFVVLFFLTFPGGRFAPRWTLWVGVAFLAFQIPGDLFPDLYSRTPLLEDVQGVVFMGFVISMVGSQIYRYRSVSTPQQRRQTKLVVSGTALALSLVFVLLGPLFFYAPGSEAFSSAAWFSVGLALPMIMLLIPLSICVAMLRSGLFDIDVVINRALVYTSLTVSLALVYVGSVVGLQAGLRWWTGGDSDLAVVASTLAIAALFVPLRRRVQAVVDRRFYRRKYDAQKTLAAFSAKLRDETNLDDLSGDLVGVVQETMQPAHASLWLREPGERR